MPDHSRDEFSWGRIWFLKGRKATLKTKWGQLLRVRLDSLGDMQAAFGRAGEEGIPGILSALAPGGTVLDIGAHIGGFSLIAAGAVGLTGKVFAFEPIASNVELLTENKSLNSAHCIIPIQAAVGRKDGSIELFVSDTDTMWATTRATWSNVLHHGAAPAHTKSRQVPLVTVDGFLRENSIENVTLAKIDVEAAEMDVLLGAQEALAQGRIEQLIIEVHSPTVKWDHIGGLLKRYGYEVADISGGEMHAFRSPKASADRLTVMDREPVRVALIGCGAVSELQYSVSLDAMASKGLAETVAIVDPDEERRRTLLRYFPTAQPYPDLNSMMMQEVKPELAIIAAPHRLHAELTIRCVEKGIHVLCEKPMAITTTECDQMIQAAERAHRLLAVGHFRRFYSSCETVKKLLASNFLGQVKSFQFLEGYRYNWPLISASVFDRSVAGGGVLIDTGAHALDLILWWLGEVLDVSYQDDAMGGVEANCQARLRMTSGVSGVVRLSRDWPLPNTCSIKCEKGWIKYSCDVTDRIEWGLFGADCNINFNAEIYNDVRDNLGSNAFSAGRRASGQPLDYFTAQLGNVVDAIRGKESLRVPGTDARKVIALIEKCYQRRQLLPMAWLDEAEVRRAGILANA